MTKIYRATTETETGIPAGSCWSEDRDVAAAYTDNQGFGGSHIREIEADLDNVLDIAAGCPLAQFEALAKALGYAEDVAQDWHDAGYLYPWEEVGIISRDLRASGYDWLRYEDDYPEGAITLMRLV